MKENVTPHEKLGVIIKLIREAKGRSPKEAASKIKISKELWLQIENGKADTDAVSIIDMASRSLEINSGELLKVFHFLKNAT